jgi:hypothetical protein
MIIKIVYPVFLKCKDFFFILKVIQVVIFFFFEGSTGVWTQGLTIARQAIYHLNYSNSCKMRKVVCCLVKLVIQTCD